MQKQVEESDYFTLIVTFETIAGALCPIFGYSVLKDMTGCRKLKGDYQDDQGTEEHDIEGEAGST